VILRKGRADNTASVRVESMNGIAKNGKMYESVDKIITFEPFVYEKTISVKILDNHEWQVN